MYFARPLPHIPGQKPVIWATSVYQVLLAALSLRILVIPQMPVWRGKWLSPLHRRAGSSLLLPLWVGNGWQALAVSWSSQWIRRSLGVSYIIGSRRQGVIASCAHRLSGRGNGTVGSAERELILALVLRGNRHAAAGCIIVEILAQLEGFHRCQQLFCQARQALHVLRDYARAGATLACRVRNALHDLHNGA